MNTQLRVFNQVGSDRFRSVIDTERNQGSPRQATLITDAFVISIEALADDPELTEELEGGLEIDTAKVFGNRYDMGNYLDQILPADISVVQHTNVGLWSWISAVYFRQLLEKAKTGEKYRMWSSYRYAPLPYQKFRYYRHLTFMNFWLHRTMGQNVARFFLSRPLYEHSDAIEQLYTQDRDFLASKGLMDAALEMYMNPKTGTMKAKALGEATGGSARRLATKIAKQLQMNYDLQSMAKEEIYPLLPPEFDAWRTNADV
jgi:hypothetical protein